MLVTFPETSFWHVGQLLLPVALIGTDHCVGVPVANLGDNNEKLPHVHVEFVEFVKFEG